MRETPRASPVRRKAGYSLVELVITLAVIAIVAAVAVPRWAEASSRHRLELAARRVTADLERIRDRARRTAMSHQVCFDPHAGGYTLEAGGLPFQVGTEQTVDLTAAPYEAVLVSAWFDGKPWLIIDNMGSFNTSGKIMVRVGRNVRCIYIDALTGEVSIQ